MSAPGTPAPPHGPLRISESSGPTPRTCHSLLPFSFAVLQWLSPCRARRAPFVSVRWPRRTSLRGLGLARSPDRAEATRRGSEQRRASRLPEAPSAPRACVPAAPRLARLRPARPRRPAGGPRPEAKGPRAVNACAAARPRAVGPAVGSYQSARQVRPGGDGGGVAAWAPGRVSFPVRVSGEPASAGLSS